MTTREALIRAATHWFIPMTSLNYLGFTFFRDHIDVHLGYSLSARSVGLYFATYEKLPEIDLTAAVALELDDLLQKLAIPGDNG